MKRGVDREICFELKMFSRSVCRENRVLEGVCEERSLEIGLKKAERLTRFGLVSRRGPWNGKVVWGVQKVHSYCKRRKGTLV